MRVEVSACVWMSIATSSSMVMRTSSRENRSALRAHQQHRHGRGACDELGVAAHQHPVDAAPSVRADDDEIGLPRFGLLDDDACDALAAALNQLALDGEPLRLDRCARLLEQRV